MSKFMLEVFTPERAFFSGEVESLVVDTPEGKRGVLNHHTPMVAALAVGEINFEVDGTWKKCFSSDGFMEVRPDKVVIMAQAVEWPEEIDIHRAQEAAHKARERLRQQQSLREFKTTQASLARALARLRVTDHKSLE